MDSSIGPLVAEDESLVHQTADTFGTVATSELSWAERVWAQACARDGSIQVCFGLGRYPNRGVLDAFGGVSRGTDQWTVRASRALVGDDRSAAGPLRYEVVEPLRSVRVVLEPTAVQPVAFDVVVRGVVPARTEDREVLRAPYGPRVVNDVVRYHQVGLAEGWVAVGDDRIDVTPGAWMSARDHSWGVRTQVGSSPRDLPPGAYPSEPRSFTSWAPWLLERRDGTTYAMFHYAFESNLPGMPPRRFRGGVQHPDGHEEELAGARFDLRGDDGSRRLLGGTITFVTPDGAERAVRVTPVPEGTGFHLGTGLYFGLDGHRHGQWRGDLHVDGDHVEHCDHPDVARRIHQLRDCVVTVEDPVGGGRGWGTMQTILIGGFPDWGLRSESTFV